MLETSMNLNGPAKLQILLNSDSGFPAGVLSDLLSCITEILHRVEVDELVEIGKHFPELRLRDVKRAISLASEVKERHYTITVARSGSLILTGVIAGVSLWLLNATLGETVKGAWLKSDLHHKLEQYLATRLFAKVTKIKNKVEDEIEDIPSLKNYGESPVRVKLQGKDRNTILVKIELDYGMPNQDDDSKPNVPGGQHLDVNKNDESLEEFAKKVTGKVIEFEELDS